MEFLLEGLLSRVGFLLVEQSLQALGLLRQQMVL
jgi:hypothetical protein